MGAGRHIGIAMLLLVLAAMAGTAFAGGRRDKRERPPFTPQHEVRVSWGAWPLNVYINMFYPRPTYVSKTGFSGAATVSYGYRFRRWLSLHANLSYSGLYERRNMVDDDSYVGTDMRHVITLLPTVRFTWLNHPDIRLYSSIGFGAAMYIGHSFRDVYPEHYMGYAPALQITPLGIAFGRSFFGYIEGGIGTHGCIVAGFGYRFNDTTK